MSALLTTSVHGGDLILVNERLPYVEGAEQHVLVPACDGYDQVLLERRAANAFFHLLVKLNALRSITPVSGWRSLEEQQELYAQSLRDNGAVFTQQFVALPGHSEHQTGLAIDLGLTQPSIDFIRPEFPYTGICQSFRAQAVAYGFVERYPAGKETITGIAHEPWHFRYVGCPHAAIMADKGLTLEEYHAFLRETSKNDAPFFWRDGKRVYSIFYTAAEQDTTAQLTSGRDSLCVVSGDNEAGFIVTAWREE